MNWGTEDHKGISILSSLFLPVRLDEFRVKAHMMRLFLCYGKLNVYMGLFKNFFFIACGFLDAWTTRRLLQIALYNKHFKHE